MADPEDRVAGLEARVGRLEVDVRHATDLGVTAGREALTAREAHQKNVELLNAIRETQADHSRCFESVEGRLDSIEGRLDSIDGRLDSIDGTLGQVTIGMHTIESLLHRLAPEV